MLYDKVIDENLKVCHHCQHHFPIGARERIHALVETCSFEEMDAGMTSVDILKFTGVATYASKLEAYQKSTNLKDAVITGIGKIGKVRVALGIMDFSFLGGSMGSVVGEKITRLVEAGTDKGLPVILIAASGGARMYEGMFSLMQMAKTCAALGYHAEAASYIECADLSDDRRVDGEIREPGRFDHRGAGCDDQVRAGHGVIKDTTQSELPPRDFRRRSFLLEQRIDRRHCASQGFEGEVVHVGVHAGGAENQMASLGAA